MSPLQIHLPLEGETNKGKPMRQSGEAMIPRLLHEPRNPSLVIHLEAAEVQIKRWSSMLLPILH